MTARDVFISHSSGDAEIARALRTVLEEAGYSCWMAPDDVVGTETWTEQILGAIADSKAMLVLVSAAANCSPHVSREVNLALGRSRAVLPIRIESVAPEGSLEYLLSLVQRVDAFPPPITDHRDRILRRLGALMERAGRPASEPAAVPVPEPETETHPTAATREKAPAEKAPAKPPAKAARSKRVGASKADGGDAGTSAKDAPKPAVGSAPFPPPPAIHLPPADDPETTVEKGRPPSPPEPTPPSASSKAAAARRRRAQPVDIGPGTVIGGFTIESLLGEGGMATVYRARQEEPRRLVALKVIRSDHAANETYRQRFLTEKETLAALEHPVIVPIYAAGESDGVLFIAMRLVDGPDLQAKITRQGRLSLRETVQVLEPIADAVDYAHATGVIHRDLKPSNIILDKAGRPYLTDFGLGKHLEEDTSVSVPGMAIGTLDYMAPEQFSGPTNPDLAPAIDLYALGCVAYACLTGQPPFVRATPQQLMYAHANETPPTIRSHRPEYPPVIDEIFNRILAKDPAARFGTARDFVSALESIVQSASAGLTSPVVVPQQVSPASQARKWVGRNTQLAVAGGAIALVVAVIFLAGIVFPGPRPAASPTQGSAITQRPVTQAPVTVPPPTTLPVTAPPATSPPATAPPGTSAPAGFPNAFESALLATLPTATVNVDECQRYESKYAAAQAMVFCPAPSADDREVFFVLFPDTTSLSTTYTELLSSTAVAEVTQTGCFDAEPTDSNNSWRYGEGPQAGLLACYARTDGTLNGVQYVWTHDDLVVMGHWLAPTFAEGLDYFSDWAVAVNQ